MGDEKTTSFLAARAQTGLQILRPAGFAEGAHLFYRLRDHQAVGVEFQASRFEPKYYVNVGFHYDFLPTPREVAHGQSTSSLEQFDIVDLMLYTRLEDLLTTPSPDSWPCGDDVAASTVAEQMKRNAQDAVEALNRVCNKWRDPQAMLEAFAPEVVAEEFSAVDTHRNGDVTALDEPPVTRFAAALGHSWMFHHFHFAYSLALIALRFERSARAREYLRLAELCVETDAGKGSIIGLERKLRLA
jgi:hypothetical protein